MTKELIQNLRSVGRLWEDEAADALEAQQHELRVKDLTIGKMANDMAAAQKRIEELENFSNEINHRLNWVKDECAVYPDNADEKAFAARIMSVLVREFPNNLVMSYREIASDYQHCANQLAAAQAQIKVLREALDFVLNGSTELDQRASIDKARKALAQPTDDSALREMLKAERERCAKVCETQTDALSCADAIRAMEDQ